MRSRCRSRGIRRVLGLAGLLAACAAQAADTTLPAVARWLAPSADGVRALLADGSLVDVRTGAVRVLTGGFSAEAPLRDCAGRTLGISRRGQLASVDSAGRLQLSSTRGLSRLAGVACRGRQAWAIGEDGDVVRFTLEANRWELGARTRAAALPDARLSLFDDGGREYLAVLAAADEQRYRHAILGDAKEPTTALLLESQSLTVAARLDLPAPAVFEDLSLRRVTVAGKPRLVAVRADPRNGASMVLLGMRAGKLEVLAEGPAFGRPQRWLNPLIGTTRMYAIHTPHIGGHLHHYALDEGRLRARALLRGVSSHRIGSRSLDNALVLTESDSGTLLVAPGQSHSTLHLLSCATKCRELSRYRLGASLTSNLVRHDGVLWAGGSDRRLHRISLPSL